MDKLKLADPTTTEELYNVLKAFKTKDPNGNGKDDEIPVSTLWNLTDYLGNAFGLQVGNNGTSFHADDKGKVICDYTSPRLKEYWEYLNRLYKEGLLDKEHETIMQMDVSNQKIAKDTVGAMVMYISFMTIWGPLVGPDGQPEYFYAIKPLKGPHGDSYNVARFPSAGAWAFSKTCRSLPEALKWYEKVMFSPEGQDLATWGLEGLTYKINASGDKEMTVSVEELCKLGGGNWSLPYVQSSAVYDVQYKPYTQYDVKNMRPYFVDAFVTAPLTTTEGERIKTLMADIQTYYGEMRSKIISGVESLDKFDAYVAKLKTMGIDEVTSIYQAAYDRRKK